MSEKEQENINVETSAVQEEELQNSAAAENPAAEENSTEGNSNPWTEETAGDEESAAEESAEKIVLTEEEKLRIQVAELKDTLLRKEADFQNYRKRMAREVSDARRVGLIDTITPFLQVFDLLDMAMKAAEASDNVAALKQGLAMILAQYGKTIDELGVQKFDAVGEQFDPQWHDAVAYENSDTAAEGVIIKQWNCGYKLGDRLLRPARVIVSSGTAAAADENAENTPENKE